MDNHAPGSDDLQQQVQALQQELARYQDLFANMTEGFAIGEAILDAAGKPVDFRILEANAAFHRQSGLPPDVLGQPARNYLPQLETRWVERFGAVAQSGQPQRFDDYNADTRRHYDMYAYCPEPGRFAILFRDISERLRMEQDRRDNQHQLRQMVTSLPGLVWTATLDAGADYLSPQWKAYTGVAPESLLGQGWLGVLHPEDRAATAAEWQRSVDTCSPFNVEYRIRRHDGAYRWFSARGLPLRDTAGNVIRWFGICSDIDDLKSTQAALVESERRYRTLFNNRINGVAHLRVVTNAAGAPVDLEYEAVNDAFETIVKRRRDDVVGRRMTAVFPGIEHMEPNLIALYGGIALNGGEHSFELFFPQSGQWFSVYVYSHAAGKCTLLFTDITPQKQAEAALREREEHLRTAFEQAAVGMAYTSPDGRWRRVNRKFLELLGYREEDLLGRHYEDLLHPDDPSPQPELEGQLHRGEIDHLILERRHLHRSGKAVWMRVTVSTVRDSTGERTANFVVMEDITARRQLEQERDATEAELRATFEQAGVGITHIDRDGRFIKVNQRFCDMTGYSPEALRQMRVTDIAYPPDRDIGLEDFRRTIRGEIRGFTAEKRYQTRQGQVLWVRITASSVRQTQSGEVLYNIAVIEDISERKRTQAELEGLFRQAAVGMAVVGMDGRIQRLNQRGCDILGHPCEELIDRPFLSITHPDDVENNARLFRQLVAGQISEFTLEKRCIRKDGRSVWTLISVTLVREEAVASPYVVTVIQDIDARKHLEAELRAIHRDLEDRVRQRTAELEVANVELRGQKERFQTVLETAADAYVAVDSDGIIVEWNHAATRLFGWTREQAIGLPLTATIIPPRFREHHDSSFRRFTETGRSKVMQHAREFFAMRQDGSEFPVELTLNATIIDGRWLINAFLRDITARREAEAALQEEKHNAEAANRAKTEFLATMSHEIRTPLNGLIGFTGLLLDGPLTEDKRRYAELARHSGESLLHLLNDFLDFSKIEAGRLELEPVEFDLHLEAQQVLALVQPAAEEKGIELRNTIDVPHRVRGDAARLRQILLNLLSNAVKFTAHGHVTLCCSEAGRQGSEVRVCFEIIDTGIGIDPAVRGQLFRPFVQAADTTRRFGGTGLGLAISRRLARAMGGEIGFRSAYGKGSTFWVELPFVLLPSEAEPMPDASLDAIEAQPASVNRGRVLVAEDNSVSQLLAQEVLKRLGCQVDVVGNGFEAVEAWRQLPYDLIFMDCDMPVMDGFQATREIRALEQDGRHVPIIAMTASALQGDPERCIAAGMDEFMSKPLRLQHMSQIVNTWMKPA